ncbi:gamma-aminobutyric acid receptor subunit alpha-2-like [Asterias amurensis]|uniref:gamma-aminobutyric acid receptor subunit alpha-2-like n=1 Tax=Asterias amurensis TaxID=7602 RepID=UPI003AB7DF8F
MQFANRQAMERQWLPFIVYGSFILLCMLGTCLGDGVEYNVNREHEEQARKNITRILDQLTNNYDKNLRPGIKGPPVTIQCDIFALSIGPVVEINLEFHIDVFFRQRWTDPRLKFNSSSVEMLPLNTIMLESIWYPDTYFFNGRKCKRHTVTTPNRLFRISPGGNVLYTQRLTIKAECMMNLEKYPMDVQVCSLHFGSNSYSEKDVVYRWKNEPSNASASIEVSEDLRFSQFSLQTWKAYRDVKISDRIGNRTVLTAEFYLARNAGFFVISTYIPCVLLVVLSWVSFWLNREATPARVALCIMTLLTITTLGWSSRAVLPKVSYAKAIDWFIVMCFGFVFAAMVEYAAVNYFTKRRAGMLPGMADDDDDDVAQAEAETVEATLRKKRRFTLLSSLTRYNIKVKNADEATKQTCLMDLLSCLCGNAEYRDARLRQSRTSGKPFNSVSRIDVVSRVIFPLSFLIANGLFWFAYKIA